MNLKCLLLNRTKNGEPTIDRIENDPVFTRSLPDNVLYKYEITYLREKDSIESLQDFLTYIETQTGNKDQAEFLKAIYLQNVIEHPVYCKKHEKLFTAPTLREALQRESASKYAYMIQKSSGSFFSSQKGMQAYDFTALRPDGTAIRLSDFRNKIVVMDVWDTWCGPCIQQRPAMIELAKTYYSITDVVFLLVSVDRDAERWKKYVQQAHENQHGLDAIIPDDEREMFSGKYLVSFIPKYILIDWEGVIIDSRIPEPYPGMKQRIENARAISESDDL
jgi:thiol-disulfide isomerase/thioredoxin